MEYLAPQNLSEALTLIAKWKGRVKPIAGGTNVIPDMRSKAIHPDGLVCIRHWFIT